MNAPIDDLVLRAGRVGDDREVRTLAHLDSCAPLRGDVLVAEVDGRAVAAISLRDGRVVADPFTHTADAVELLRLRAERLTAPASAAGRRRRRGLRALTGRAMA